MSVRWRCSALLICVGLLLLACEDDSAVLPSNSSAALVIVVENVGQIGAGMEQGFELFRAQIVPELARVFGVPETAMAGLTLPQIIDRYGEDWQISEIVRVAAGRYGKIVSLTDSQASGAECLRVLSDLATEGYTVDLVFNLHGREDGIRFGDAFYDIGEFTRRVTASGARVRALYQTCCHGRDMIDEWEAVGVVAVSGAADVNSLAIFSPVFFMRSWLSGGTFESAVQEAYAAEVAELRSYSNSLPVALLLTPEVLANSWQQTGGSNPGVAWDEFD